MSADRSVNATYELLPGAPTIGTATTSTGQVVVTFTPPSSQGGLPVTGYLVKSSPGNFTASGTSSPLTILGINTGLSYTFSVASINAAGQGSFSAQSNSVTPYTMPDPPVGVTATSGNAQATVAFLPPVNNGGSPILSYSVVSTPGSLTATGTTSPINVNGLTNGVAYTFAVKSVNIYGTSPASASSNIVTPCTTPGAPSSVTATAGNAQATVAFTAPADNGGSSVSGYSVISTPGGVTVNGSASPTTVTGLTNGTSYVFTVKAINAAGTGTASGPSNSVTPITTPSAPTIGLATSGNAQAVVNFTPSVSDGGSAITTYTVTSNPGGVVATTLTPPATVTGLTNGIAYTFSVTATNAAGTSAPSAASIAVTPSTVPGAPTIGTAIPYNGMAGVSFTTPASNGGSTINTYKVTSSPEGKTANSLVSPIMMTGLTPGVSYTFTVVAYNINGPGAASAASNAVTPYQSPTAPTAASAVAGDAQAIVSFSPPTSDGYKSITGYKVVSSPGGVTVPSTASPVIVTGLNNGTAYTFSITATNGFSYGPAVVTNSVTPSSVAGAPTIGQATAGSSQATVAFTPPAINGGSVITGYTVTSTPGNLVASGPSSPIVVKGLSPGTSYTFVVTAQNSAGTSPASSPSNIAIPYTMAGPPSITKVISGNAQVSVVFIPPSNDGGNAVSSYTATSNPGNKTANSKTSPLIFGGLSNGTSYTFTLTATNAAGDGTPSTPSDVVVPQTTPGPPVSATAVAGNAQAIVSFLPPIDNGGNTISGYTVVSTPGNMTFPGTASPITVTGLTNGISYSFTVTATNAAGTGPASVVTNSVTPIAPPSAPLTVSATAGNGQAAISFSPPADNGGSIVTGYTVTTLPDNKTTSGTTTPITVTGLTNGNTYTFTVSATNAAGIGLSSLPSNSVTPAAPPGAPIIVSANSGNASATIIFTPPIINGGSAVTSYTVTSSPGGKTSTGPSSPITLPGLTNGVPYTVTVVATNAAGSGTASLPSKIVIPYTIPDAPTIGNAVAGDTNAVVSFSGPINDGGNKVTLYTVTSTPGNITVTGPSSPLTVPGLTNGISYTFTAVATNSAGDSAPSASSNITVPCTISNPPIIGVATAGNTQAMVAFTAPTITGGSQVTSYIVTSTPDNKTATGTKSPVTITNLTNGVAYTFTVKAVNAAGTSLPSSASNSATPSTTPGPPIIGVPTAGNSQATVAFTPPIDTGGSPITSYTVASSPGGIIAFGTKSPIVVGGLMPGSAYSFNVTASNINGSGPASSVSSKVIPYTTPGAPKYAVATAGNTQASITFVPPTSNGFSPITTYTVTSTPGNFTASGQNAPIVVTGLSNGISYSFTVTATNAAGAGPASVESNSITPFTAPGTPHQSDPPIDGDKFGRCV